MIGRLAEKWKNLKDTVRQNRVLSLWESKKYDKMASLLKKSENYASFKIDEFPFIFFLINEKDHDAISALLTQASYRQQIMNDEKNPMGMTPICYAFMEGEQKIVQLLEKHGDSIKKVNSSSQNVLHMAAIYKQIQSFKKALGLGIDINLQDQYGNTPFHYAARTGLPQLTGIMIAGRARKLENKLNQYPVHMSIQSGSLETFQLLKADALGAYPKYHPIHSAVRSANPKMLHTILTMKPTSLNMKDIKGLTPLHHAVIIQDIPMLQMLLQQPGILVNETDIYGNTPLHLAFIGSNIQICKLLIAKNANLDIPNQDNLSPVDYGITSQNRDMHSLLRSSKDKSKKIEEWVNAKL